MTQSDIVVEMTLNNNSGVLHSSTFSHPCSFAQKSSSLNVRNLLLCPPPSQDLTNWTEVGVKNGKRSWALLRMWDLPQIKVKFRWVVWSVSCSSIIHSPPSPSLEQRVTSKTSHQSKFSTSLWNKNYSHCFFIIFTDTMGLCLTEVLYKKGF